MTVTITRILTDCDLRRVHKPRHHHSAHLRHHQAVLLINRDKTRARIIDSVGACHNYYAPTGEQFDVDAVRKLMREGLGIETTTGQVRKLRKAA